MGAAPNPYDALGELFVADVLSGERKKIGAVEGTLSQRLIAYSRFRMENATTAGDALLVNDLAGAASALRKAGR